MFCCILDRHCTNYNRWQFVAIIVFSTSTYYFVSEAFLVRSVFSQKCLQSEASSVGSIFCRKRLQSEASCQKHLLLEASFFHHFCFSYCFFASLNNTSTPHVPPTRVTSTRVPPTHVSPKHVYPTPPTRVPPTRIHCVHASPTDANEERAKQSLREKAKQELVDWYRQHDEQVTKTRQANRLAGHQDTAGQRVSRSPGHGRQTWWQVTKTRQANRLAGHQDTAGQQVSRSPRHGRPTG